MPPADTFPRGDWPVEVARGYKFYEESGRHLDVPDQASVAAYYLNRAPERLPELRRFPTAAGPGPGPWSRVTLPDPLGPDDPPAVANVRFAHLFGEKTLDVLVCEMGRGQVYVVQPYLNPPKATTICQSLFNPAHAEVVDLDQDGVKDVVVADLGNYLPTDALQGSVVWLRGDGHGAFKAVPLAVDLGRVSDARPADFDGDGDLDLVVAVFGWHRAGQILLLENRTPQKGYDRPQFTPRVLDPRHGTIHVPVADLNGDGRPDFVALVAQEHETVVAFLNDGGGRFTTQTVYQAPHPAFGSSGIELVDLDRDGDLDVLLTNGDVMDAPLLRPDQGVRWLENRGKYPFEPHDLATLYGAHRAVAADLDGDGDLDVAASTFLPPSDFGKSRKGANLDAVVVFEQTTPGVFERHPIESVDCDHPTCDLGDFDGDGRVDLVVGRFLDHDPRDRDAAGPDAPTGRVLVWKNEGKRP